MINLIEGTPEQLPVKNQSYTQQLQQIPNTLPIAINKVDYTAIVAIVGIIGLLGVIALLAYLKR